MNAEFETRVYEIIKAYRDVPDEKSGVCVGILSPRETALFDAIISAMKEDQGKSAMPAACHFA